MSALPAAKTAEQKDSPDRAAMLRELERDLSPAFIAADRSELRFEGAIVKIGPIVCGDTGNLVTAVSLRPIAPDSQQQPLVGGSTRGLMRVMLLIP
jgi:hypothetical protein